jgi:hypothetical protein
MAGVEMKLLLWARGLVGNNLKATVLIGVFVALLLFFAFRAKADQPPPSVHLLTAVSFGCLHGGPVLGVELEQELAPGISVSFGPTLWGTANGIANNWDWHARMQFSRGAFGAAIGPAYLQNIDSVNGSHAEMSLTLFWRPWRVGGTIFHLSDAGTTRINCGRNAAGIDWRLR